MRSGRRNLEADVLVDPQRSATYCIGPDPDVWIARPSESVDQVAIRRRGVVREILWPPNALRAQWPGDLPIAEGEPYEIVDGSGAVRATLTFHAVEHSAPSAAARVADAALAGCEEQVTPALRELARTMIPRELWLASDRGQRPSYRAGDPMRLVAQANADGWLYCTYRRGDGTVIPIFHSGALDGARVRSHEMLTIPGQRRFGELFAGPRGEGRVSCWLADRDIGPELPHAVFADAARPLPAMLVDRLDDIFNEIGGAHLVKATVLIRIEQPDASR